MNKNFSKQIIINDHEFKIKYYTEYDFPENFILNNLESWSGLLEVSYSVPQGIILQSSQAEAILEDAKDELYREAVKIAEENPNVYGKYNVENNFHSRVSYSISHTAYYMIATEVRAVFRLYNKE